MRSDAPHAADECQRLDVQHTVSSSCERQRRVLLIIRQRVIPVSGGENYKICHRVSVAINQCHFTEQPNIPATAEITTSNNFTVRHFIIRSHFFVERHEQSQSWCIDGPQYRACITSCSVLLSKALVASSKTNTLAPRKNVLPMTAFDAAHQT